MRQPTIHPCLELFEREIDRFQRYARKRCTSAPHGVLRKHVRYHRSWPLLIATHEAGRLREHSASLHDASDEGIGFIADQFFTVGDVIFIQLFWHEASALRVPAVVRHVSSTSTGILIGCEYALANAEACERSLQMETCCS